MKKISFRFAAVAVIAAMLLSAAVTAIGAGAASTDTSASVTLENEAANYPIPASTSADKSDYYSRIADMNEDWMLNSADARVILRLAARLDWVRTPKWLPAGMVFGDIDENGKLTAADARYALRVAARLDTISDVLADAASKPVPVTQPKPTTTVPAPASTRPTTTQAPTTTEPEVNPYELIAPICDEFALRLKSSAGTSYTIASDGVVVYLKSNDVLKDFSVIIDRNGNTYILSESNETYTVFGSGLLRKLGVDVAKIRSFVAKFYVPEFDYLEDYTVTREVIKDIPLQVAAKDGVKFYFYGDGTLEKIVAKDFVGKTVDFTVEELSYEAAAYTELLNGYEAVSSNKFILKNGLSLISNMFQ